VPFPSCQELAKGQISCPKVNGSIVGYSGKFAGAGAVDFERRTVLSGGSNWSWWGVGPWLVRCTHPTRWFGTA